MTHTTAVFITTPTVRRLPPPLDHTPFAGKICRQLEFMVVIFSIPFHTMESSGTISKLHEWSIKMSHFVTGCSLLVELSDSEFPPTMMRCLQENCNGNHLSLFVCSCDDSVGVFPSVHMGLVFRVSSISTDSTGSVIFVPLSTETSTVQSGVVIILWIFESEPPHAVTGCRVFHVPVSSDRSHKGHNNHYKHQHFQQVLQQRMQRSQK